MPIQVYCPAGHKLNVPRKLSGTRVRCPSCSQEVLVPVKDDVFDGSTDGAEEFRQRRTARAKDASHIRRRLRPTITTHMTGRLADAKQRKTVHRLAAGMAAIALLCLFPTLGYWPLATAPGWVVVILMVGMLLMAYACWLALLPDFSSLWVAMIVLAMVAAIHATGMAIFLTLEPGEETIFGMAGLRAAGNRTPAFWCGAIMLLSSAAAYRCGRASHHWRKTLF